MLIGLLDASEICAMQQDAAVQPYVDIKIKTFWVCTYLLVVSLFNNGTGREK